MLLSINWLREFVDYQGEIEPLGDKLTMLGLEIEEIVRPFEALEPVVVGHVLACEQHPEADKLSLCTVDVGEADPLAIVCGAPNVAQGQKVAVAKIGCVLPGDFKIKKAKIRGQASFGMICAEDELGLGEDHKGIMVLDPEAEVGRSLVDVLGLDRHVLDVSITPNRADCLSVLGIAREVGMAFDLPVAMPKFKIKESSASATALMRVEIDESAICRAYRGRILDGVAMKPSPDWMRYRLLAVGQRPINNIVDVTNYVMFELGQPLHAFDLDLLEGGLVRVARATNGMEFTTLDGQKRKLNDQDILIWDAEKPVGLGGVMGGENSEMREGSSRVFLESAVFTAPMIRKTARRLALPSEASYRFERGVDQPGSLFALNRAAVMMAELAEGELLSGICEAEPEPWTNKKTKFRPERANQLLGVDLDKKFCAKTLTAMGCEIGNPGGETWNIEAPAHRLDLEREADIIEEVGRVYGLDRIEATLPTIRAGLDKGLETLSEYGFWNRLRDWACGLGLHEAINYSFVGMRDLDLLGLPETGRIPVKNPLSDDQDVLRSALAPGLLATLRQNVGQGNDRLRIFELAHIFEADRSSDTTAREPARLGLMLYGRRNGEGWPHVQEDVDYSDLKGLVEHLFAHLHLEAPKFSSSNGQGWLYPCVSVTVGGKDAGFMGRVRPELAKEYNARKDVWIAELDSGLLAELFAAARIRFQTLPVFPPVKRDMTLAADKNLPVGRVLEAFEAGRAKNLENVFLADVFEPEDAPDKRNLTFRLTFRSPARTLKDKEVDKEVEKVATFLSKELNVIR